MASEDDKRQPLITVHVRGGLVFGERDGQLVSINDVPRGLACNCVCPNPLCRAPLVAHKGDYLAYHFKHHKRKDCRAGFETGLHRMAKDVLAEAGEFRLPEYSRGYGKNREVIFEEKAIGFQRAALEKRTGRTVADVILYTDRGPLLVELVVTHWCEQAKIDLLKVADLACVEVDLGPYREIWDKERRILNMLDGRGQVVEDLFNLPVKARIVEIEAIRAFEAEEAENRRRLREWEAGKAREKQLIDTLMRRYPRYDIAALVSERTFDGQPAFEAVRQSDGVYERVLAELDAELSSKVEEARRLQAIQALQQKLLAKCDATMDPQVARLFLTTQNPAYEGRPIDTCVDESSFQLLWLAAYDRANGGKIAWRR